MLAIVRRWRRVLVDECQCPPALRERRCGRRHADIGPPAARTARCSPRFAAGRIGGGGAGRGSAGRCAKARRGIACRRACVAAYSGVSPVGGSVHRRDRRERTGRAPARSVEHGDRLDVRGVREHVDHARRGETVPALVDEHGGVARQRARRARHVDDPRETARLRRAAAATSRARPRLRAAGRSARGGGGRTPRGSPASTAKRFATAKRVRADRPLRAAFSSARRTSAALPSTPSVSAPLRAIGSVKLPRPQKKSAMRSPACGASSATARRTSTRLIALFTCVNSAGPNGIVTANSGSAYASDESVG